MRMSANVTDEEKFIYWTVAFQVPWIVAYMILTRWLTPAIAGAVLATVWIPAAQLLPGRKRISAGKTLLLAVTGALLVFAAGTLIQML